MTASFMIIMVKPFVILLLSLITRMGSINCFLFLNFLDKNQKIKIGFEATGHYVSSPVSYTHLIIPHKEKDEKIATFYSQLAFNYILSIIYSLIYKRNKH